MDSLPAITVHKFEQLTNDLNGQKYSHKAPEKVNDYRYLLLEHGMPGEGNTYANRMKMYDV